VQKDFIRPPPSIGLVFLHCNVNQSRLQKGSVKRRRVSSLKGLTFVPRPRVRSASHSALDRRHWGEETRPIGMAFSPSQGPFAGATAASGCGRTVAPATVLATFGRHPGEHLRPAQRLAAPRLAQSGRCSPPPRRAHGVPSATRLGPGQTCPAAFFPKTNIEP
jgi:hypothetical protein